MERVALTPYRIISKDLVSDTWGTGLLFYKDPSKNQRLKMQQSSICFLEAVDDGHWSSVDDGLFVEMTDFSILKDLLAAIRNEDLPGELVLSVIWYSSKSNMRGAGNPMPISAKAAIGDLKPYSMAIPPNLHGTLSLRIFVSLRKDIETHKEFTPRAGGCIFQSIPFEIALTGERSLFPVYYVHMGASEVLWKLEFEEGSTTELLDRNLSDCVSIFINRDHPDHLLLLADRNEISSLREEVYATIFFLLMQKIHALTQSDGGFDAAATGNFRKGSVLAAFEYWDKVLGWNEDPFESSLELYEKIKRSITGTSITQGGLP
jgi:hypothetical protein